MLNVTVFDGHDNKLKRMADAKIGSVGVDFEGDYFYRIDKDHIIFFSSMGDPSLVLYHIDEIDDELHIRSYIDQLHFAVSEDPI